MPDEISTLPADALRTLSADVARLQSNSTAAGAAAQRAINSALRLIAVQAERIQVLEDAARRTPAGRSNFEAAATERAKMLVPVTQQPPAAKPQRMPEPKSPEEIPAYVAKLRAMAKTLATAADRQKDLAEKVRLQGLAAKLETKADLWEAKLTPAEPSTSTQNEPKTAPAPKPEPAPAGLARRRMI